MNSMNLREKSAALFFFATLFHDPIIGLTGQALIAHAFLVACLLFYAWVISTRAATNTPVIWLGNLYGVLAIVPFALLGLFYSLVSAGEWSIKIQFAFTFLLLPLLWSCIGLSKYSSALHQSIITIIYAYIIAEFVLILAQLAYMLIGIGLVPNSGYEGMISGSQFNGNNLAAIITLLAIYLQMHKSQLSAKSWIILQIIVFVCLLLTFSRLALIIYTISLIFHKGIPNKAQIVKFGMAVLFFFTAVLSIDSVGNASIDNLLYKAKSILQIFTIGLETDSSTMGRSESYFNFVAQLPNLGWGSAQILNYAKFTRGANFSDGTLYINPHSLLIELGYWMGYSGLILFINLLAFLYFRSLKHSFFRKSWLVFVILSVSSIPSSAIPLASIWVGMLLLGRDNEYLIEA